MRAKRLLMTLREQQYPDRLRGISTQVNQHDLLPTPRRALF